MPMIAFIGVRISWLMAARNVDFGLVRLLGRVLGGPALLEEAGVLDGDRGLLGEALQEGEVGRGEGRRAPSARPPSCR